MGKSWKNLALILTLVLTNGLNSLIFGQNITKDQSQQEVSIKNNLIENNYIYDEKSIQKNNRENQELELQEEDKFIKLMNAILLNDVEQAKNLINEGVDFNKSDAEFLLAAVMLDHREMVALLIGAGIDINLGQGGEINPLISAILMGHKEIASQLVLAGAKLFVDSDGEPESVLVVLPFMFEENKDAYFDILETLLNAGANPNSTFGEAKWTILMDASSQGNLEAVKLLVAKGANVNDKTTTGVTPCSCAEEGEHFEVVKFLKNVGAKCAKTKKNHFQKDETKSKLSLKDALIKFNERSTSELLDKNYYQNKVKQVEKIIGDQNVNLQDEDGNTILMSILKRSPEHIDNTSLIINKLIQAGIDLNVENKEGNTALLILSCNASYKSSIYKKLIQAGADVRVRDSEGHTPLINLIKNYFACECIGFTLTNIYFGLNAIEDLINAGVDINARDKYGKTALDYALKLSLEEGVSLPFANKLLKLGAKTSVIDESETK